MKRAPSEDLFRLIKSLSKGEKRNFKLLAGLLASDKHKKYIELFDLIDKQDGYHEAKLSKMMKDLYGEQIAAGKHYLYRLILKSLIHFRSEAATGVANMVEQVRTLMEKELLQQASKVQKKALIEATEIEDFHAIRILLQLETELLLKNLHDRRLPEKLRVILERKTVATRQMENLDAYRALGQQMILATRLRSELRSEQDRTAMEVIRRHPLLVHISEALSVRAKIEYHSILRKICSYDRDLQGALEQGLLLKQLFDEHPNLKEELIGQYYSEVSNLCTYFLRSGQIERAFSQMAEFRQSRNRFPKARTDFFMLYYVVFIAAAMHIGAPERVVAIVPEIEEELATLVGKIPKNHLMWLHFLLAYAHLMVGIPSSALHYINKVLIENRSEVRIDLQCDARILNMFIHYELGNYTLVESEFQSTRRFLEKNGHLSELEKMAIRAVKAMAVHAGGPSFQEKKETWMHRFEAWKQANPEDRPYAIDFAAWIESQLTGKTLAQILKSKLPAFAGITEEKWATLGRMEFV